MENEFSSVHSICVLSIDQDQIIIECDSSSVHMIKVYLSIQRTTIVPQNHTVVINLMQSTRTAETLTSSKFGVVVAWPMRPRRKTRQFMPSSTSPLPLSSLRNWIVSLA